MLLLHVLCLLLHAVTVSSTGRRLVLHLIRRLLEEHSSLR